MEIHLRFGGRLLKPPNRFKVRQLEIHASEQLDTPATFGDRLDRWRSSQTTTLGEGYGNASPRGTLTGLFQGASDVPLVVVENR
jgi:hypothetical protein